MGKVNQLRRPVLPILSVATIPVPTAQRRRTRQRFVVHRVPKLCMGGITTVLACLPARRAGQTTCVPVEPVLTIWAVCSAARVNNDR